MKLDLKKVTNVVVANVCTWDYPDLVDAFIESADYEGREMTEEELNALNENYSEFVHEQALESLH